MSLTSNTQTTDLHRVSRGWNSVLWCDSEGIEDIATQRPARCIEVCVYDRVRSALERYAPHVGGVYGHRGVNALKHDVVLRVGVQSPVGATQQDNERWIRRVIARRARRQRAEVDALAREGVLVRGIDLDSAACLECLLGDEGQNDRGWKSESRTPHDSDAHLTNREAWDE